MILRRYSGELGVIAIVAVLFCAVTLSVSNSYYQLVLTLVLIWAVLGQSWNILSGYSGLVSFGQAAFFGLGGYFVGLTYLHFDLTPWFGIIGAGLAGALAALIIGIPTFRLKGHYFALAMLAYPQALLYVFEWLGYQEVSFPLKREHAFYYMQFSDQRIYTLIALVLLLATLLLTLYIERSRFGISLRAIKQNEIAAECSGIDTRLWKLRSIILSGAIAGAAGGLYSVVMLVITPVSLFGLFVSAQALILTMFGGSGTLWGALIGAAILIPFSEMLRVELGDTIPAIQGLVLGSAIILIVLLAPEGIFWAIRDRLMKAKAAAIGHDASSDLDADLSQLAVQPPRTASGILLRVEGLSKSFGGLNAMSNVSLEVRAGEILGIIGPNGAGKSTLFNLLNGITPADAGVVEFDGMPITNLPPNKICALGVGRTFQVARPFSRMSVMENALTAAYVTAPQNDAARELASSAIAKVGLGPKADASVSQLSAKELRQTELARALASRPQLLLLDEPFAGLGRSETDEMVDLLKRLNAESLTIVIIEHTMHAMVRLAERLIVLDHGRVIASGPPSSILENPEVIEAYLGKKWAHSAAH